MVALVQKYGGTSVASLERMRLVAARIKSAYERGDKLAVVVSAMAGMTDQLLDLTKEAKTLYNYDEYDVVVSAGEQISAGLMALTLQNMGLKAKSFLAWQLPCYTDERHGNATIESMDAAPLMKALDEGIIPVVAGFQGITRDGRLSTLGRGGSDTTAVALAASMKADLCEIYTDVDGVYTADPRIVPKARKLETISYEEMYELAALGAKVLQTRSVEMAMKHSVPVAVKSSFQEGSGTLMTAQGSKNLIAGIVCSKNEVQASLFCDHARSSQLLERLVDGGVIIDMAISVAEDHMVLTTPKADLHRLHKNLDLFKEENLLVSYSLDPRIAKISVVGLGLREQGDLLKLLFHTLQENHIEPSSMVAEDIRATFLVPDHLGDDLARTLHSVYGLD